LCAGNTGSAGRWPATRWRYIARYIRATRGCPLRGGMAPTKVGGYQQQAHTAIACRPAAGTTSRTTSCVDALCTEPRRQPRLASTTAGRSHTKKRRPCGRRFDLNDAQSSKLDATSPQPGPCPSSLHRGPP